MFIFYFVEIKYGLTTFSLDLSQSSNSKILLLFQTLRAFYCYTIFV
jgi:hypothetical protein